jgi:hypothetical protein
LGWDFEVERGRKEQKGQQIEFSECERRGLTEVVP